MSATRTEGLDSHLLAVVDSLDEFLAVCVPFCDAGIRAGRPVVGVLPPARAEALRAAVEDPAGVSFMAYEEHFRHPPAALQGLVEFASRHAGGNPAAPVHMLGEGPPLGGLAQDGWLRYEAATNDVLSGHAVQQLCVYHRQAISPAAEAELRRTHPLVVGGDATSQPSADYQDPTTFMATRRRAVRDPVEAQPPAVVLCDPTTAETRRALKTLADDVGLPPATGDDLVVAANEALTNALLHGRPPATVHGWCAPGKAVVAIHDSGTGPLDPLLGLRPAPQTGDHSGLGLWLAHQLCPQLAISHSQDGFTVRIGVAVRDASNGPATA